MATHYSVLGVPHDADEKTIRRAYLRQSLRHHPDKNPSCAEEAKARFVEIGRAYEVLSDPCRRAQYDRELASGEWRCRRKENGSEARRSYDTYREAYDAYVSGLSESELNAAMGVAAAVGSIVGSVVGSKLLGRQAGGSGVTRSVLGTVGSVAGSVVGREAATGFVRSVHDNSVKRVAYDEQRRVARERGEDFPDPPPAWKGWDDLKNSIGKTVDSAKKKSASEADSAAYSYDARSQSNGASSASSSRKWKQAMGTAVKVAGAVAELRQATSASKNNSRMR